jgi:hypothetical protein
MLDNVLKNIDKLFIVLTSHDENRPAYIFIYGEIRLIILWFILKIKIQMVLDTSNAYYS